MAWPKGVSRTIKLVHYENGVPKCTDELTYQRWKKTTLATDARNPVCDFCTDCNAAFQSKRVAEGRCENPDIRFREDADGWTEGYMPKRPAEPLAA